MDNGTGVIEPKSDPESVLSITSDFKTTTNICG